MLEMKVKSAADFGLTMSAAAADQVKQVIAAQKTRCFLRIAVIGGGCSGFQYAFSIDDTEAEDDLEVRRDNAVILVDETSLNLLQGSEIDFHSGLESSMFTVSNPNATSSCGCGTSFAMG